MANLCCFTPKLTHHPDGTRSERFRKAPLCSHGDCWDEYFLRNPVRSITNLATIRKHGPEAVIHTQGYMHLDRIKARRGMPPIPSAADDRIAEEYGLKFVKRLIRWAAKTTLSQTAMAAQEAA